MAFWRTYYHLIWATEDRQPLITPIREKELYSYIIGKADYLGCIVHAIGGIENHIHLVASIVTVAQLAFLYTLFRISSSGVLTKTREDFCGNKLRSLHEFVDQFF